ncbi:MAG: MaoC family dehydratase N-terminal domain-containing protein [Rhodobacteraceae bacterium]|nr:MaoC family dehydratase N-terminal domain-containing protein [Paracoccaceae bacterium]
MAFDPQRLLDWDFGERRQRYDARDAILYALGAGLPLAGDADLPFVYEDGLRVLPAFAVTLASPGMWPKEPALAIDWPKLLHMAQAARFHAPLPDGAEVVSRARIAELWDRGADKGSVCVLRREVTDAATGTFYCTIDQTVAMRGNGGFGGATMPRAERPVMPDRAPDHIETVPLSARAALIYRLSGDLNPLHIDPEVARKGGFPRPILHGLASYGTACAVVLRAFCGGDPARLAALDLRFAGVVYPGDRLDFACWRDGVRVLFEARVGERVVLDQGVAMLG